MRLLSISIALVLAVGFLTTAFASAQSPEVIEKVERELTLKRIQGVWVPDLLLTTEGAQSYPLGGRALLFQDNEFARIEGKHTVAGGKFQFENGFLRLTVSQRNPWDLEAADTREKMQYAYKIDGDILTLCYSTGNKGKADDLTPGEGRVVVVYKRKTTDTVDAKAHDRLTPAKR